MRVGEGRVRVESYAEAWNQLAIGNTCHEVMYTLVGSAANLAVHFLAVIAKTEIISRVPVSIKINGSHSFG